MIHLGICEDNNSDPLKVGRIKVRVFGIHTEIKTGEIDNKLLLPKELPWAIPAFPINTQSIDGMSDFQVPKNGSIVLVSFLDQEKQQPIYFGTVPKIAQTKPDFSKGFSDPNKEHPSSEYLKESPVSRLARNEKIDKTVIQTKRDSIITDVDCKEETFNEPETPYNAEYTKNRVIETEAGHFVEIDDTSGAERIHIYHKSGSFQEFHPDGHYVENIKKKRTTIIIDDDRIYIEGNKNIHITKSENIHIEDSQNILIDKDKDVDILGTENVDIGVDQNHTITGNKTDDIGGDQTITIGGNEDKDISGVQNVNATTINLNC